MTEFTSGLPVRYVQIFLRTKHELHAFMWEDEYLTLMDTVRAVESSEQPQYVSVTAIDGAESTFNVTEVDFVYSTVNYDQEEPEGDYIDED